MVGVSGMVSLYILPVPFVLVCLVMLLVDPNHLAINWTDNLYIDLLVDC